MSNKEKHAVRKPPPKRTGKRGIGPAEPEAGEKPDAGQSQKDLPGMEDREIAEIERAAEDYATIRDRRITLNAEEHELKEKLLGLMKKHSKEKYTRDGVEVRVIHEKETVKIKLHKEGD